MHPFVLLCTTLSMYISRMVLRLYTNNITYLVCVQPLPLPTRFVLLGLFECACCLFPDYRTALLVPSEPLLADKVDAARALFVQAVTARSQLQTQVQSTRCATPCCAAGLCMLP